MYAQLKPVTPPSLNPIGQRLRREMKRRGVTSTELARRAEVKTSFIYDIISGKSANPSTVKLARVAETLGISLSWLVGNSDHEHAANDSAPSPAQHDYVTIPRVMVDVSAGAGTIVSQEQEGESYYFRKQWIKEHLSANPTDLRMLYVRGDSMEPTLCHNDLVLVDTTRRVPSPPGIFVLFDGFGLVAKRLEYVTHHHEPRLRIISDNPQYSVYERMVEETLIIGRIVWFAREM
jgi:phage repressor protein C with HTH and peptisase S24 domain